MAGDARHQEHAAEEMDDDVALKPAARAPGAAAVQMISVEQTAITSQKTKTVMRSAGKDHAERSASIEKGDRNLG